MNVCERELLDHSYTVYLWSWNTGYSWALGFEPYSLSLSIARIWILVSSILHPVIVIRLLGWCSQYCNKILLINSDTALNVPAWDVSCVNIVPCPVPGQWTQRWQWRVQRWLQWFWQWWWRIWHWVWRELNWTLLKSASCHRGRRLVISCPLYLKQLETHCTHLINFQWILIAHVLF